MIKKITGWLGIEEAYQKGLIARISIFLCLIYIIFGVIFVTVRIIMTVHPAFPPAHWTDMLIESGILVVGLAALFFIRNNNLRAANRVVLLGMLFAVTLQTVFLGGPTNDISGSMGLLLFGLLAILLLDGSDRWIAIGAVVIVFVVLTILSASGQLAPIIELSPMGKTFFAFFVWLSIGIIIALVLISSMGAIRREPHLIEQSVQRFENAENSMKARYEALYLSTHDALTDLYNRLFFETEISRLENSRQYPISVIMILVDGLKEVNDKYGMRAGDVMLIDTARILSKVFRNEDILTRFGGDEFAVLLPACDQQVITKVLNRLNKELEEFNKKDTNLPISISLGFSTAVQGESLKDHHRQAEKEMRKPTEPK